MSSWKVHFARLASLAFTLVLCGCASGPPFVPATAGEEDATIYVYRVPRFINAGGAPRIALNGREVALLKNGSYLALVVAPGSHKVEQVYSFMAWPMKADPVTIETQRGRRYFVRMDTDGFVLPIPIGGALYMHSQRSVSFKEVGEAVAWPELQEMRLSE